MTSGAKLYNSRIIDTYLQLIRDRYPDVSVSDVLLYAGMELYEVADQGHWFTQEQTNRFHEKCVEATGNRNIAREAGRFAASPGTLGVMRQYGLSLTGPLKAFQVIGNSTRKFTLSSEYTSRKLGTNRVEILVKPKPGVTEEPFQCENRQGFFEAIIRGFDIEGAHIEHTECMFNGGDACRYIISWKSTRAVQLKRARDIFSLMAILGAIPTYLAAPIYFSSVFLPVSAVLCLAAAWMAERARASELECNLEHQWDVTDQLSDQIEVNYRNTNLSREVGQIVVTQNTISGVINSICEVLKNTLDYDRGLILLTDPDNKRLEIMGAYGYVDQYLDLLTNIAFRLDKADSKGVFVVSFKEQRPFLVNNISEIESDLSPRSREFMFALGTQAFICVPIILEGKSIGVLAVDNMQTKKALVASDVNLLMGVSPAIAISIQNMRLLESRTAQFESTLQVLADSIDARDFLTAGHSEKVAEYAVGIAEELGLPSETVRVVRTAALLHDYGKIGVPDSILKKKGALTEEERAVIRTHPTKTKQILDKVSFDGPYMEIPDITYAHHEKWDGTGYPRGLKGEEIPLASRIIAAADFYEAITSERHYRDPMAADQALREFQDQSGKHFEPPIVEAFSRYIARNSLCLIDDNPKNDPGKPRKPRIPYRTHVATSVDQRTIAGSSVDISQGGLYITSPETDMVDPGTEITITFTMPETSELVQIQGRIAWVNRGIERPAESKPDGFGVQFSDIPPKVHSNLMQFISCFAPPVAGTLMH